MKQTSTLATEVPADCRKAIQNLTTFQSHPFPRAILRWLFFISGFSFVYIDKVESQACDLIIVCPPEEGGFYECFDDVPPPNTSLIQVVESCNTVSISVQVTSEGSGCAGDTMLITRLYIVTDGINTDTCSQFFYVNDDVPPLVTCTPIVVTCPSQVPPPNPAILVVEDNCEGDFTVTVAPDITTNFICPNRYTIVRVYTITDICDNTINEAHTITVNDIQPPTITCPPNVTVTCASSIPAPNISGIVTVDNCGGGVTVTVSPDVTTNFVCPNNFLISRTYIATDVCGNSASCTQTIRVLDNIAPTITCPANVTVSCAALIPAANIALAVASDNCAGTVAVTVAADVTTSFVCA